MKRRGFLQRLFGVVAAAPAAAMLPKVAEAVEKPAYYGTLHREEGAAHSAVVETYEDSRFWNTCISDVTDPHYEDAGSYYIVK